MTDLIEAPREIVARVHEQIAAQSPEHASLVAAYALREHPAPPPFARPRPPAHPSFPRMRRLTVYSQCRLSGLSEHGAARRVGVSQSSAGQYEADFLASLGGAW